MGKTFLELFRRYEPSQNLRAVLETASEISLRTVKESRMAEVQCTFPSLVPKQTLYQICDGIAQA